MRISCFVSAGMAALAAILCSHSAAAENSTVSPEEKALEQEAKESRAYMLESHQRIVEIAQVNGWNISGYLTKRNEIIALRDEAIAQGKLLDSYRLDIYLADMNLYMLQKVSGSPKATQ